MSTTEFAFSGSIPEYYDSGLGPVLFTPYGEETARRASALQPGSVLEVACGSGRVTRPLRAALPADTRIVATDLSEGMLEFAKSHSPGNIEWQVADAQALPFPDNKFDVVVCQFCMMFVPDKELAVREFHRVLRPGGTVLAFMWDSIDHQQFVLANKRLVEEYFAPDPPDFLNVPFSMNDPAANMALFRTSFDQVAVEGVGKEVSLGDPEIVAKGCLLGNPIANEIAERDPNSPKILVAKLTEILKTMPTQNLHAWLVTAVKNV